MYRTYVSQPILRRSYQDKLIANQKADSAVQQIAYYCEYAPLLSLLVRAWAYFLLFMYIDFYQYSTTRLVQYPLSIQQWTRWDYSICVMPKASFNAKCSVFNILIECILCTLNHWNEHYLDHKGSWCSAVLWTSWSFLLKLPIYCIKKGPRITSITIDSCCLQK